LSGLSSANIIIIAIFINLFSCENWFRRFQREECIVWRDYQEHDGLTQVERKSNPYWPPP
jgi:hypothetical protein